MASQSTSKIVVFGSVGVGKTSLILDYIYGGQAHKYYDDYYAEDSFRKLEDVTILGVTQKVFLDVLDTGGTYFTI